MSKREAKAETEAEAETEPESDPALLYGTYYGYGLVYYTHPYVVSAGFPYPNGWTDGPNNGVGHYGYHYLGKREAEAEPEVVNHYQTVSFVYVNGYEDAANGVALWLGVIYYAC